MSRIFDIREILGNILVYLPYNDILNINFINKTFYTESRKYIINYEIEEINKKLKFIIYRDENEDIYEIINLERINNFKEYIYILPYDKKIDNLRIDYYDKYVIGEPINPKNNIPNI